MNESQRNDVIASNEDSSLNNYLDDKDSNACDSCDVEKATIEFNNMMMCTGCYDTAKEQAELMVEDEGEE